MSDFETSLSIRSEAIDVEERFSKALPAFQSVRIDGERLRVAWRLSPIRALAFHEGRLFVVAGNQLLVVDVADPTRPRAVGAVPLPSALSYHDVHLTVSESMVAVAIEGIGAFVFAVGR
ncbi:MAG: hypothetical protein R3272_14860 [Candidatus Promineifilaceae bacterium]|nr:hypothetical protein [Candidatus Promineifilaceae bacterium]